MQSMSRAARARYHQRRGQPRLAVHMHVVMLPDRLTVHMHVSPAPRMSRVWVTLNLSLT